MPRHVRVENLTRGTVVARRGRVAASWTERMIGLLRSPEPRAGEGLLIERTSSIHMWFMRFPIDVVFIDRERRVTKVVRRLRPWRIVPWAPGARDCLELPSGAIEASATQPGDRLEITEVR